MKVYIYSATYEIDVFETKVFASKEDAYKQACNDVIKWYPTLDKLWELIVDQDLHTVLFTLSDHKFTDPHYTTLESMFAGYGGAEKLEEVRKYYKSTFAELKQDYDAGEYEKAYTCLSYIFQSINKVFVQGYDSIFSCTLLASVKEYEVF